MRLTGRGDDAVRATHVKTLEVTPNESITARATCVIAVGAHWPETDNDDDVVAAGPVRITVSAGGESFGFDAQANSAWQPGGPAVIRRSAQAVPGTLATHATAAAADLPRALVTALRDPASTVVVDITARLGIDAMMLYAADADAGAADPRLAAELAAADAVLAEDPAARSILRALAPDTGVLGTRGLDRLPAGRVLVVATADLPGSTLDAATLDDRPVEVAGLPPRLAVAAASASRAPLTFAVHRADAGDALRNAPAAHRVVVTTSPARLPSLLRTAADLRPGVDVLVTQQWSPPTRLRPGAPAPVVGTDDVHCCIDPAPGDPDFLLDARMRSALDALIADGVSTRTAARAVAELTGWPRRRAYDAVLGSDRQAPEPPVR